MLTVILGLLVFTVVVAFHELGHFFVARRCGVSVERFSIGFGPVVFSRRRGDTEYAVSALPLGGYVKMRGDDPRNRTGLTPGDFFAASWRRRVLIAFAGPFANFVFAVVLSIVLAWVGFNIPDAPNTVGTVPPSSLADSLGFRSGDVVVQAGGREVTQRHHLVEALIAEDTGDPIDVVVLRQGREYPVPVPRPAVTRLFESLNFPLPAVIGRVVNGAPAYESGLQDGDRILRIEEDLIAEWADLTEVIHQSPGRALTFEVQRGDRVFEVDITPMTQSREGEDIGLIGISPEGQLAYQVQYAGWEGVERGFLSTVDMVGLYYAFFWNLITNFSDSISQVSGPVAIIQATGDAAQRGADQLLSLAVMLNVALMVFNLLPIPILDGGMIMLSVIEGARGRPMAEKGLTIYQGVGLSIIGALLIFVLINDPMRMVKRQQAVDRVTSTPSGSP